MRTQAKNFIGNTYFIYSLGIIFIFCIWFIVSLSVGGGSYYFPSPIDTFKKLGELLSGSYIYKGIGWSLLRSLIGFSSAFLAALILGTIAGQYNKVYLFLKPIMLVAKSIPTAALVFIFLAWSGTKFAPVYIVFLIAFPILYESIAGGMHNVSQEIIDSARLDGARFFGTAFKVRLPLALPYVIIGFTSTFALSLKTEIMAEIITGDTGFGLGCTIVAYRYIDPSNLTPVFAVAFITLFFILIFDLIGMLVKKYIKLDDK